MTNTEIFSNCPNCDENMRPYVLENTPPPFCVSCRFPLRLVAGKYQLLREIGEGGFSTVFLARHIGLTRNEKRVVKVLKPEIFMSPGMDKRFKREVQLTSELSLLNEHIIKVYDDFGEIENLGHYYVMEYLEGPPLTDFLEREHLPSLDWSLNIVLQICEGMQAAHELGIIHRDLKPDNLLLIKRRKNNYFVKILDFGIAKPTANNEVESKLTMGPLGTPYYMSPEQGMNVEPDARSDLFSMGIIFYELLTGVIPFIPADREGKISPLEIIAAKMLGVPAPFREAKPEREIPEELEKIVFRLLEKEPSNRFQSAEELIKALKSFQKSHSSELSIQTGSSEIPTTSDYLDSFVDEATDQELSSLQIYTKAQKSKPNMGSQKEKASAEAFFSHTPPQLERQELKWDSLPFLVKDSEPSSTNNLLQENTAANFSELMEKTKVASSHELLANHKMVAKEEDTEEHDLSDSLSNLQIPLTEETLPSWEQMEPTQANYSMEDHKAPSSKGLFGLLTMLFSIVGILFLLFWIQPFQKTNDAELHPKKGKKHEKRIAVQNKKTEIFPEKKGTETNVETQPMEVVSKQEEKRFLPKKTTPKRSLTQCKSDWMRLVVWPLSLKHKIQQIEPARSKVLRFRQGYCLSPQVVRIRIVATFDRTIQDCIVKKSQFRRKMGHIYLKSKSSFQEPDYCLKND